MFVSIVNSETLEQDAQKIEGFQTVFDLTQPAVMDNVVLLDFMDYFQNQVNFDIRIPQDSELLTVVDSVYTVTSDVYALDSSVETEDDISKGNLGSITNLPELRALPWDKLMAEYREATTIDYIIENRTINYSINKYEFEIYDRLIWVLENKQLNPDLIKDVHTAIYSLISSQYKITAASMEDARSAEKYEITHKGSLSLRQAEVQWENVHNQLEKGNTRPAMNALQHANFKAHEVLLEHGLSYNREYSQTDTDQDGLVDLLEHYYRTDPKNQDTDGDGLNDYDEVSITNSDPLNKDSNEDGINDGAEDTDGDGLTNLQETELQTDPQRVDTDRDGLSDFFEVNQSHTDPTRYDTDSDNISDGRELELGLSPLNQDSDADGTSDQYEIIEQPIPLGEEALSDFELTGVIPSVTITGEPMETQNVNIRDAHKIWKQFDRINGIVGHVADIETPYSFVKATITFQYDSSILGSVQPENLRALWYDDKNGRFVLMPNQTLDIDHSTVSFQTDHFSFYLLVDWKKWQEDWQKSFDPGRPTSIRGVIKEVVLASVFSDRGQGFLHYGISPMDDFKGAWDHQQMPTQNPASQTLKLVSAQQLISSAVNQLSAEHADKWKALILPVDATTVLDVTATDAVIDKAKQHHIKIFPVNINGQNTRELEALAEATYGRVIHSGLSEESDAIHLLSEIYEEIKKEEDADSDGVPDRVETAGIRIEDGSFIYPSISLEDKNWDNIPDGRDSDGDGLIDGYELGYTEIDGSPLPEANIAFMEMTSNQKGTVRITSSNPSSSFPYINLESNPWIVDSDEDGYVDAVDAKMRVPYVVPIFMLHGLRSNVKSVYGAFNDISDKEGNELNNNSSSTSDLYSNVEKQKINDAETNSIADQLRYELGKKNVFAFNYANRGDFYATAGTFNKYLNNLIKAGAIESPIKNGKPVINMIVHSLGGLVARSFIELSLDKDSDMFQDFPPVATVEKLITMATPHWGGANLASLANNEIPDIFDYPAVRMLSPSHCIYEGCDKWLDSSKEDYFHGVSFKENINASESRTKYYAMIGVPMILREYNSRNPGHYIYFDVPEWSKRASDDKVYADQAGNLAGDYINDYYPKLFPEVILKGDDGWVSTNSGLGYKVKWFRADLQIGTKDRMFYFGPKERIGHTSIYDRDYVQKQIMFWIKEK
jgi:hypothetical protein